jgi:hypothetical protein
MSAPFSGISRLPSLLRISLGKSGEAVRPFGRRSRKSATESTSVCPIARNFAGGRSAGDDRRLSGSDVRLEALFDRRLSGSDVRLEALFVLDLLRFATAARLDLGKSPPGRKVHEKIAPVARPFGVPWSALLKVRIRTIVALQLVTSEGLARKKEQQ